MFRHYIPLINEYLRYFPCVVLIGARQTGKSTLIQMLNELSGESRPIFDLERRADFDQIAADPDQFLRLHNQPIAIDEAQQLPALFQALRVAIDNDRNHYGKYLLSGSSSPELLSAISESLAGRVGVIEIAPLSFSETQGVKKTGLSHVFDATEAADLYRRFAGWIDKGDRLSSLNQFWLNGGYPEPWLRSIQGGQGARFVSVWREQYIKTYIERDIARLYPNLNGVRFRRFIELLAASSGAIINYSNFASILDVSQPTVKDYIRIAHGTFIWRNLPAYTKNASKRVVKHPKGYICDSGLMHHILQIPSIERLRAHPQMGVSWEGVVIEEILRTASALGVNHTPYFYRTSAGAEVDLVLEGEFGLIPFEIKHTQTINPRRLRPIKDFVEEFQCPYGVVINNDIMPRQLDDRIVGIPFTALTDEAR